MKLNDLVALALQGYKIADIRELVSLADNEQSETGQEKKDTGKGQGEVDVPENPETPSEPEGDKEAIDYKALYEEQKALLEKVQAENIRKDNSGEKEEDFNSAFEEIVRNYM